LVAAILADQGKAWMSAKIYRDKVDLSQIYPPEVLQPQHVLWLLAEPDIGGQQGTFVDHAQQDWHFSLPIKPSRTWRA
jgi:hypothetical protein